MFLRHPLLSSMGIPHGFGLLSSEPLLSNAVTARQVHGIRVEKAPTGSRDKIEADALWTDSAGTAVGVWTADCLPVLLVGPGGRVVSAVHAGWRGAVRGIVLQALLALKQEAAVSAGEIRAVLGPSAGRCCYRVGPEVWEEVSAKFPEFAGRESPSGHLDLPGLVLYQLREAGLAGESIASVELCTICHPDLFFSHRRQGSRREGRSMISWIRASS